MATELSVSQERSERINRLKRFLAPQVAELIERSGDDRVLDGRRVEVVAVFCDLRGFTAFSVRAEPETVIRVLREYYDALETVVSDHGATLINFFGDGAMILFNAPVSCVDPAFRAVGMASAMQKSMQGLLAGWRALDDRLGFGVGLAMGPATVGRIGSQGRLHYTAIGNVVYLASRLCSSAEDSEILIHRVAADAIGAGIPLVELAPRTLKGFDQPVPVFTVATDLAARSTILIAAVLVSGGIKTAALYFAAWSRVAMMLLAPSPPLRSRAGRARRKMLHHPSLILCVWTIR